MKLSTLLSTAVLWNVVSANPFLDSRALSNSPTGGYAPGKVSCPNGAATGSLMRTADGLSDGEKDFIRKRKQVTHAALEGFLHRAKMKDFNVDHFLNSYSPTVGLAFSGGGWRAMLAGAGQLKALDSRTKGSLDAGGVGGLLQSASYIAGLSGGSWLVGSVILNNFTTIDSLQNDYDVWNLENSILAPEGKMRVVSNLNYYTDIISDVKSKEDAGFDVSLTDYWGRALSHQFIDWEDGGPGVTWSSIAKMDLYKNADHPFPIVVADGRNPGEYIISKNATVFEFNPLEFGSFDPTLYAFTPVEYIGTKMSKGIPTNTKECIRGFDNAGYVLGTSSSLFNALLANLGMSGLPDNVMKLAAGVLSSLSQAENDIADYTPNPFYGVNPANNPSASTYNLTLVDGGLDLQNIPLHPLIQPSRNVDVIFAYDNSADTTYSWPNGTAMVATYERSLEGKMSNGTLFPSIPDINTFVNLGLNSRPTFFGCDAANITAGQPKSSTPGPLIVYVPNSPYTFFSNVTTMTMKYSTEDRDAVIDNGYHIASQFSSADDPEWPACLGCAIVHREHERKGTKQGDQCKKCFERYCWNGKLDSRKPKEYEPVLKKPEAAAKSGAAGNVGMLGMGSAVVAAVAGLVMML